MKMAWTAKNIPDLSGKIALVTGANSGLGLETTRALAAKGATVVMACRGEKNAAQAMAQIQAQQADAKLEFLLLDLSDLSSVRAAVAAFKQRHQQLHILCNNAGLMTLPYGQTKDGFELLFGTNHLGHFALSGLLLELLRATPKARVVTLASIAHRKGQLPMDDLHWQREPYSKSRAYGRSKLANLMFALELDRRLQKAGSDTLSVAAHPGYSATNIVYGGSGASQNFGRAVWNRMGAIGNVLLAQPAHMGALSTLYAAVADTVKGGDYIGPDGYIEFRGHPTRVQASELARNETLAAELWARSEHMTQVQFPL